MNQIFFQLSIRSRYHSIHGEHLFFFKDALPILTFYFCAKFFFIITCNIAQTNRLVVTITYSIKKICHCPISMGSIQDCQKHIFNTTRKIQYKFRLLEQIIKS